MDVHQISVQFVAAEDRLLLRVSTREGEMVSAWLTRRLLRGLWQPFDRLLSHLQVQRDRPQGIVHPDARDMLARESRDKLLADVDFETEFRAGHHLPALGDDPLLVGEVKLTATPLGQIGSQWRDAQGRELALDLDPTAATALQQMLLRAIRQADWRLDLPTTDERELVPTRLDTRVLN